MSVSTDKYTPLVVPMNLSSTENTVNVSSISASEATLGTSLTSSMVITSIKNYEMLTNKPKINGVELFGDKTAYELGLAYKIKYDTVEGWSNNREYIPLKGELIIYTDYDKQDGVEYPAIKVGDGLAYAVDLPFVGDETRDLYLTHINDTVVHITQDEREFWNNKVRCYINYDTIVFTTR